MINPDRMWHYIEGMRNWDPIWTNHGIRIIPGPSSLWFDAVGRRLPAPLFPGFDTLGTLAHIMRHRPRPHLVRADPEDHREGVRAVRAPSRTRTSPGATSSRCSRARLGSGAPAPVEAFKRHGADFVVERDLPALVRGMNALTDEPLHRPRRARGRDRGPRPRGGEPLREGPPDHGHPRRPAFPRRPLARIAAPHRILDPDAGPLIAVKLHILTRKTLGGLQTDLDGRVLQASGEPLPGLYAAGEVAGFGGGGMHGYRALEGTFLGGCLFSGRTAGRRPRGALA